MEYSMDDQISQAPGPQEFTLEQLIQIHGEQAEADDLPEPGRSLARATVRELRYLAQVGGHLSTGELDARMTEALNVLRADLTKKLEASDWQGAGEMLCERLSQYLDLYTERLLKCVRSSAVAASSGSPGTETGSSSTPR